VYDATFQSGSSSTFTVLPDEENALMTIDGVEIYPGEVSAVYVIITQIILINLELKSFSHEYIFEVI